MSPPPAEAPHTGTPQSGAPHTTTPPAGAPLSGTADPGATSGGGTAPISYGEAAPDPPGFLKRRRTALFALLDLVVFVVLWHIAVVDLALVNRVFFPSPGDVAAAFGELVTSGQLSAQLAASAQSWVVGFGIGAVAGVLCGLVVGSVRWVNRLTMPLLWSLWATPLIALQPTLTAWLDYGSGPIIVLVFLSTMIPVALNTATGASEVTRSLLNAGRVFGADRFRLYVKIRFPWAVPYMIGGLRLAVPTSMIGLLVGEMVGSPSGIGSIIINATSRFRTGEAFAAIGVYVVLSVVLVRVLDLAERRAGGWRVRD